MKILAAVVILGLAPLAMADEGRRSDSGDSSEASSSSVAVGVGLSESRSGAKSSSGAEVSIESVGSESSSTLSGVVGEGGEARAEGGDAASEASTGPVTVTLNEARERSTRTIKNTPTVAPGDIYPTVQCFRPKVSGGLSLPGFGASVSRGDIDEDCVKREYIRLAFAMGLINRAVYMLCSQPTVWEDFGDASSDCLTFVPDKPYITVGNKPDPPPTPPGMLLADVTEQEYRDREERVEIRSVEQQTEIDSLEQKIQAQQQVIVTLQEASPAPPDPARLIINSDFLKKLAALEEPDDTE